MSFPATASYPSVASYPGAATYPASAAYPSAWTPAQIANLVGYYNGLLGGVYTDTACTVLATEGQTAKGCKSLYGVTNNATQSDPLLAPIADDDGLWFDTSGNQFLQPASDIVLDEAVGFTIYHVDDWQGDVTPIGNLTTTASIFTGGGSIVVLDDDGANFSTVFSQTGLVLYRLDANPGATLCTLDWTGSGGAYVSNLGGGLFTINQLGACTGLGVANASTLNGYQLWIMVARQIVEGSPEDLQIRAFIQNLYGVNL